MEFLNKRKPFLNDIKQENLIEFEENKRIFYRKKAFDSFLVKTKKGQKYFKKNEQKIFEEIKSELNLNLNLDNLSFNLKSFYITKFVKKNKIFYLFY